MFSRFCTKYTLINLCIDQIDGGKVSIFSSFTVAMDGEKRCLTVFRCHRQRLKHASYYISPFSSALTSTKIIFVDLNWKKIWRRQDLNPQPSVLIHEHLNIGAFIHFPVFKVLFGKILSILFNLANWHFSPCCKL